MSDFELKADIAKTDDEERIAFGLFSVMKIGDELVIDGEEDRIETREIEKAAYEYVKESRDAGLNHSETGVGNLVETMVFTKEKVEALKKALTEAGIKHTIEIDGEFWWGGHHVTDEKVWKSVKSGDIEAWSIGGSAVRTKAE